MFLLEADELAGTFGYHPRADDILAVAARGTFAELLVIDDDVPDLTEAIRESRLHTAEDPGLAPGVYWFCGQGSGRLMVVGADREAFPPVTGPPTELPADHPLIHALGWFEALWPEAMKVPQPLFTAGDLVVVKPRGHDAIVRTREFRSARWIYTVVSDGTRSQALEHNLELPPPADDPEDWIRSAPVPAHRFTATLTRVKLDGGLTDTVFSFRATRTLFRPYQFKPVMKLLGTGRLRLLIADEVGLGKTIEAGLVWTEMEARRLADRVLVVCPSALVAKWRREMEERFDLPLVELTMPVLTEFSERLAADTLPARAAHVCSLERLRSWPGLEDAAAMRPQFDLVIVDEAHSMRNTGTRSNALGSLLSEWADALVFLSATPLNLRNSDLHNLMDLLVPGEFEDAVALEQRLEPNAVLHELSVSLLDRAATQSDRRALLAPLGELAFGPAVTARPEFDLLAQLLTTPTLSHADIAAARRLITELHALSAVVTRTRKIEVQEEKPVREPRTVHVIWTPTEVAFHDEFRAWCQARADAANMPLGFSMQMPLRLVGSCLPAARDQVLGWTRTQGGPVDEDAASSGKAPAIPQLAPHPELVAAANAIGAVDTKFDSFVAAVEELVGQRKQLIVFTFSRATLAYLNRRLAGLFRVAMLHGGVPQKDRQKVMADFRAGAYDVLLANRVASEGLDFEFCSAVVNYDLPWNPMEVEQRIGRIDRIGQVEPKIHVVNFHTPGTIESDIIARVMDRIGVFERAIGELEPILADRLRDLERVALDFTLTAAQREHQTDAILAAVEERARVAAEVETASTYLLSADGVDIEGLEANLTSRGRYVGQAELAHLITDWVETVGSGQVRVTPDGRGVSLRGSAALADQLDRLVASGERSRREVEDLAGALRQEVEIHLSLDQEWSRAGGPPLLTANHALARAALRVPGHRQARYAYLRLNAGADVPPGRYLVQLAVARWDGLRPSREIWSSVIDLRSLREGPQVVGDAMLAALAEAALDDHPAMDTDGVESAVRKAQGLFSDRLVVEDDRRRQENTALLATRRISVREVHQRKVAQIRTRIETLRQRDKEGVIPLFEAQITREAGRLARVEAEIDQAEECGLRLEPLAVAAVEVSG